MRPSLRLGKVAGIDVGLHWSIALIAVLLTMSLAGTVFPFYAPGYAGGSYLIAALATAGLFLSSIVAHELGHSVVAESSGVKVKGITLFALGGVASLDGDASSPGAAARIALAGPAVSVGIGVASLVTAGIAASLGFPTLLSVGLAWLGLINLSLAVFNMLPALPLDGGRVLQAALWKRHGDRHRATISAATVGRYIGWGLVFFGLWQFLQGGSVWLAFIGMFVIVSARAEAFRARLEQQREAGWGPLGWMARPSGQQPGSWSPPAGPWAPPSGPPRTPWHDDTVIEVDGHRVD
jgi:Zn-dependent protease